MNRREALTATGAGVVGLFLPQKVQAVVSPEITPVSPEGLTDEGMADVILHHPKDVSLYGDTTYFGQRRYYHYAEKYETGLLKLTDWRLAGCVVGPNATGSYWSPGDRVYWFTKKSIDGCMVKEKCYGTSSGRIRQEVWTDISDPELKYIKCWGNRNSGRHFARVDRSWREL